MVEGLRTVSQAVDNTWEPLATHGSCDQLACYNVHMYLTYVHYKCYYVHAINVLFTPNAMEHLLEIQKIVEGGVSADRTKVISYTKQLADKLSASGETEAAKRLHRVIGGSKADQLLPALLNTSRLPVDNESRLSLAEEREFVP